MARFARSGRRLISETPLSLLALTRHDIEPHEKSWFARCRADYLRTFPLSLLELLRVAMLLMLVGAWAVPAFSVVAIIGWVATEIMQFGVLRHEARSGFDPKQALHNRAGTIKLRAVWWTGVIFWAALVVPEENIDALVALGFAMMVIDGLSAMSLPHLGLAASLSGVAGLIAGLFIRQGWDAAPLAAMAIAMASFMHWSLYNLYYMFATRRIRTRRLSESNDTIRLLLNQYDNEGSDWLYEIDADLCIRNPSQRFYDACGLTPHQLQGTPIVSLVRGGEVAPLVESLQRGQPFRRVEVPVTVGSEERWWSINGRPVSHADGTPDGWRGFIADITVAKQAEAKVAFMAHYDNVTQLPNRTLFNATLERAFTRIGEKDVIGLLYVDLDHFKAINDTYGHAAGDRVLCEVSRRIEEVVRPRDMVARLGGDEFVVLMPDLDTTDAGLKVAQRVLEAIGNAIEIDGQLLPIGTSIGVAFAPHDAQCGDELLRAADLAMYDAKSRGRRGISVFDPEMQTQMADRRQLELDLRAAIARSELELHYQPLLDIQTGDIAGYEALLRWHHGERGLISPDVFIPIAEDTGTIVEIGEWVIRTALAEAAKWPEHLSIAVNISPAQVRDRGILTVVIGALSASGIAAQRLELEITENLLMQESEEVLSTLHRLRDLGVRIALDDFGTGYSSLNYLRSFPFDKIKIDRCFVNELATREDCQAIVRSVIALANELKMTTTAEGVEFGPQLDALRDNGCDQVQGFLFSRALPAGQLDFGQGKDRPRNAANG